MGINLKWRDIIKKGFCLGDDNLAKHNYCFPGDKECLIIFLDYLSLA